MTDMYEDAITVKQLREELARYPDNTKVLFFLDWDTYAQITNVADQDNGTVLLGDDLPAECYVTDFRYEDP